MISFVDGYYGWLGNQMFQYAATRALAWRRGTGCVFPSNWPGLYRCFPGLTASAVRDNRNGWHLWRERGFSFDPAVLDLPDGTLLQGYFQSERYFSDYSADIRREFGGPLFDKPMLPGLVSIHVRRGDYLTMPEHHPPVTIEYLHNAMDCFPGYEFLAFSDDYEWVRANLGGVPSENPRVRFSIGLSPLEDMALMSRCAHNIIANSSFSWWAAWINRNPEKRIIAPARWFGPAKPGWDTKDLLPKGWEHL